MPKLRDEEITQSDLENYLNESSDFSFEMKVVKLISELRFRYEHNGSYEDPATKKYREFDIRANYRKRKKYRDYEINFELAIEAKNLQKNFPLLIYSIPRTEQEAYHQIIISKNFGEESNHIERKNFGKILSINIGNVLYQSRKFVGKSLIQVGKKEHDGEFTANDSEVYDKWSQAVNSSYDLAQNSFLFSYHNKEQILASVILPILVVPNETLWEVKFDKDGSKSSNPKRIDNCSYYINKDYEIGLENKKSQFSISHLEIMTFNGLKSYLQKNILDEEDNYIFPSSKLDNYLRE